MFKPKNIISYNPTAPLTASDMEIIKVKMGSPYVLKTDYSVVITKRAVEEGLITLTEDQKAWLAKVEA